MAARAVGKAVTVVVSSVAASRRAIAEMECLSRYGTSSSRASFAIARVEKRWRSRWESPCAVAWRPPE